MRVFIVLCLLSVPAVAQWLNYKTPGIPRLPDGKPNLSAPAPRTADGTPSLAGVWAAECAIYDGNPCFTRSLFFDLARDLKPGDVEMTPWAAGVSAQREGREHVDDPYGFCMPPGVPRIDFGGGPFKILQTPGVTALLYETLVGMIFRQVFTDGRPLPDASANPPGWGTRWAVGMAMHLWWIPQASGTAVGSTPKRRARTAMPCLSPSASAGPISATWTSPSPLTIPKPT